MTKRAMSHTLACAEQSSRVGRD